jgi:hypothetical protein
MERRIVGFRQDDERDWVADLECGHGQHVRHSPPWQVRPWVLTPEGRAGHLGTWLSCRLCDETGASDDGRSDFDFLFGSWKVRNRRLRERLKGCTEWEEFESRCRARPILGGLGNMDEFVLERASGRVEAVTVRLYNPAAGEWSIYWAAGTGAGRFDVPMVGRFDGPRGEFFSHEVFEGRHILARFIWAVTSPDACRWEQSYSADGGKTWETNWTMEFSRPP